MLTNSDPREEFRREFLQNAGWGKAKRQPLAGDASTRSYERLTLDTGGAQKCALLMNAPPGAESAACPPGAAPDARKALGYNAEARLAGPNLGAFIEVAEALRKAGLSAPVVYAADIDNGLALVEDLGDDLYTAVLANGADERLLYETAVDALIALRASAPKAPDSDRYTMLTYDSIALEAEVGLAPVWYWEKHCKGAASAEFLEEHRAAWAPVFDALSAPSFLVLRDYHADNLIWLPSRAGHKRVGVIDFQDGLMGSPAYDLVSLLEDARRDVSLDLAQSMLAVYCEKAAQFPDFDAAQFRTDYAILGAQRNAKILGVFARLIHRDDKPRYLQFMTRAEDQFRRNLAHDALAPVRAFYASHMPDLAP